MLDPLLSLALNVTSTRGGYALLLGSGISRAAGIPTGWDIVLDLIRKLAAAADVGPLPNPETWYRTTYHQEADYSAIIDSIGGTEEERRQLLRGYFEPTEEEGTQGLKTPTTAHRAIAGLAARGHIRVVITTNFDRLLKHSSFSSRPPRVSAIARAKVGHIERTDTEYYLRVREKGNKKPLKALLDASPAAHAYLKAAGIEGDLDGPLFRPLPKRCMVRSHIPRQTLWVIAKAYTREAGIDADRIGGWGVGAHSLRKTAITNALQHGAPLMKVKELAGHSDIRTTQLYY